MANSDCDSGACACPDATRCTFGQLSVNEVNGKATYGVCLGRKFLEKIHRDDAGASMRPSHAE